MDPPNRKDIWMERFTALSRGTQLILAAGVLLLIDTFLPWQDFGGGGLGEIAEEFGADLSLSAWHGFFGYVMGLLTIALLVWFGLKIAQVALPVEIPEKQVVLGVGVAILAAAVIKNLDDAESTIWAYIGVLLAAGIAAGAYLYWQEPETAAAPASTYEPPPPTPEPPAAPPPPPAASEPPASPPPASPPPSETP
jgi:hypothetical protein